MASLLHLPQPLSLPTIHACWTVALSLPPTAQLSNLRRLVRAVTKDYHPALRPLSLAALCQLYLDLALAYAFLGEYYLASKVFKEATVNDATNAVAWFGLGLAQAELAKWKDARQSWKKCLMCFQSIGHQQEGISYALFQSQDVRMLEVGLESGEWTLERTRVEFNWRVALRETGSKLMGVAPRTAGQKRPGLNGIPAGLRFGPGWDATLQSLDSPLLAQYVNSHMEEAEDEAGFASDPGPAPRTPPSCSISPPTTLPPRISSRKPLPRLSHSPPEPILFLPDPGSFNDHKPSLNNDPFTDSPGKDISHPFDTSSLTLIAPPYDEYHERFSRQPTLFTPEDHYLYDKSDEGNDESCDTLTAIDNTIASWNGLDHTLEEQTYEDPTPEEQTDPTQEEQLEEEEEEEEEEMEFERSDSTSQVHSSSSSSDGEILLPRTFEGFGPPGQERRRRWDSALIRRCDNFPGNGSTFIELQ